MDRVVILGLRDLSKEFGGNRGQSERNGETDRRLGRWALFRLSGRGTSNCIELHAARDLKVIHMTSLRLIRVLLVGWGLI